jgi:hypothetical protein
LNGNDLRIELVDGDDSNAADPIDIDDCGSPTTAPPMWQASCRIARRRSAGASDPYRATCDVSSVVCRWPCSTPVPARSTARRRGGDLGRPRTARRRAGTRCSCGSSGGQLVLDDDDDVEALPEWRPGADGHALAGRGEVRLVDGLLSSGDWGDALAPATLGVGDSPTGFVGVDMLVDPRLTLSQRAGVQLPELGTIIAVLAGYVLLVGPVMYLVLRRARRLTAAWVAIPAVALLVGTGVVLTGSGWRSSGHRQRRRREFARRHRHRGRRTGLPAQRRYGAGRTPRRLVRRRT